MLLAIHMYSAAEHKVTESMSAACPFGSCGNDDFVVITTYMGRVDGRLKNLLSDTGNRVAAPV